MRRVSTGWIHDSGRGWRFRYPLDGDWLRTRTPACAPRPGRLANVGSADLDDGHPGTWSSGNNRRRFRLPKTSRISREAGWRRHSIQGARRRAVWHMPHSGRNESVVSLWVTKALWHPHRGNTRRHHWLLFWNVCRICNNIREDKLKLK